MYVPDRHLTQLLVLDARAVHRGPVARVCLRHHLPYGFHGTWTPHVFVLNPPLLSAHSAASKPSSSSSSSVAQQRQQPKQQQQASALASRGVSAAIAGESAASASPARALVQLRSSL